MVEIDLKNQTVLLEDGKVSRAELCVSWLQETLGDTLLAGGDLAPCR